MPNILDIWHFIYISFSGSLLSFAEWLHINVPHFNFLFSSSSPPRKQVHSLPNGFVGNGDVGAHSGFVGVSGDLLDDSGGNAEFEGNAYEGAAGSVSSEELPFRVYFIVSYTSPIITVLYRCIETTYFAEIF